jgi:hypothetical protein
MEERTFWTLTATEWVAMLTVVLAGMAVVQALIYYAIHRTTQRVERAYVDLSHDPPGLRMHAHSIRFSIAIKNHGKTPADVTGAKMFVALAEGGARFPATPIYETPVRAKTAAFLMPGEAIHQWELRPQFPRADIKRIKNGERLLWLVGYVDYTDQFGRFYRSGYARRYIPKPLPGTKNNLVFETTPGHNFDMETDAIGRRKYPERDDGQG